MKPIVEPYLTRAYTARMREKKWNGEYYVNHGPEKYRPWEFAEKYRFVSAGGRPRWIMPLRYLTPESRIWVHAGGEGASNKGYVGVGIVKEARVIANQFFVDDPNGKGEIPITQLDQWVFQKKNWGTRKIVDPVKGEYVVAVRWLKTVPLEEAIWRKGLFAYNGSVCRPTSPKWDATIDLLKKQFQIGDHEDIRRSEVSLEPTKGAELSDEECKDLDELDSLEETYLAKSRKEQSILRNRLFSKSNNDKCGICETLLPVELLVAAHIKKRAHCTDEEKRDLNNILPMCKFGCDELFERGYLQVTSGVVTGGRRDGLTQAVSEYIELLAGRRCKHWNSRNAAYFAWRNAH